MLTPAERRLKKAEIEQAQGQDHIANSAPGTRWVPRIVGVVAAILVVVVVLAVTDMLPGGGLSQSEQDAYDTGYSTAQELDDGYSASSSIITTCQGLVYSARAYGVGVSSGEADAWRRGCEDGAPDRGDYQDAGDDEDFSLDDEPALPDTTTSPPPVETAPTTASKSGSQPEPTNVPSSGRESASLGSTEAVLSYKIVEPDTGSGVKVSDVRLKTIANGTVLATQSIQCPKQGCYVKDWISRVQLAQFEPGDPHVIVNMDSGGGRCCTRSLIYSPRRLRSPPVVREWPSIGGGASGFAAAADRGLRDANGDGYSEFVSRDGRFPTYASMAEAVAPLQVWALRDGSLVDVTREFPGLLKQDAAILWDDYQDATRGTRTDFNGSTVNGCFDVCRGLLGAWAADQALMGRWKPARVALQNAVQRGELEGEMSGPASGEAYLRELETFLQKNGYVRSSSLQAPTKEPDYTGFKTPSGNIECVMTGISPVSGDPGSLECVVHSAGTVWSLPAYDGKATRLKKWNSPARPLGVLGYDQSWQFVLTCESASAGVTCRNGSGNGFFLSRERQQIFGPSNSSSSGSPIQRPGTPPSSSQDNGSPLPAPPSKESPPKANNPKSDGGDGAPLP